MGMHFAASLATFSNVLAQKMLRHEVKVLFKDNAITTTAIIKCGNLINNHIGLFATCEFRP